MRSFTTLILILNCWLPKAEASPAPPYVPLTPYADVAREGQAIDLVVRLDLMSQVLKSGGAIFVVRLNGAQATVIAPDEIDQQAGRIRLSRASVGRYFASTDALKNDFPIVTHWDSNLNDGRGGVRVGAIDFAGALISQTGLVYRDDYYDRDPQSPYQWNTGAHGLFSSDAKDPNAHVPDFTRYVGSDFSVFGFSKERIQDFSADIVKETGFPVVHMNGNETCRSSDLKRDAPYFQVVHACPVGAGATKGLATVIAPPWWNPERRPKYPILFFPFYDVHRTFNEYGRAAALSLGRIADSTLESAIAVLWNGGAGNGTFGTGRPVLENVPALFRMTERRFSAMRRTSSRSGAREAA